MSPIVPRLSMLFPSWALNVKLSMFSFWDPNLHLRVILTFTLYAYKHLEPKDPKRFQCQGPPN